MSAKSASKASHHWKPGFGRNWNSSPDPSLRTHKLSGKLEELWSFSVTYDTRVLFYFTKDDKAVFIDIGSHDEVYWAQSWCLNDNMHREPQAGDRHSK